MKKPLVAAALLGPFAASAFAAPSVTMYGLIDTGIYYNHYRADDGKTSSTDTVSMKSGQNSGSRWGLKGTEDLGSAKVSFILENGFNDDDGTADNSGRLFGREASITVSGAYGSLTAGRVGKLVSTAGSTAMGGGAFTPYNGGWNDAGISGFTGSDWGRVDNSLTYVSPSVAGFALHAQYSFKADSMTDGSAIRENSSKTDRYAALGVSYDQGPWRAALIGDYTMWKNDSTTNDNIDNGYNIILGGAYDFKVVRAYAMVNYFDHQKSLKSKVGDLANLTSTVAQNGFKGWGAALGADIPAFGGVWHAMVDYRDAKVDEGTAKYKRWGAAGAYEYFFSKRTSAYAAVTYSQQKAEGTSNDGTPSSVGVLGGLIHKF